jgi:hypothetical protein
MPTTTQVAAMVQAAIGELDPLEFEFEGLDLQYHPRLGTSYAETGTEVTEELFLGISWWQYPAIVIRDKKLSETDDLAISLPIDSQESVTLAVAELWYRHLKALTASWNVSPPTKQAQCHYDGDDVMQEISDTVNCGEFAAVPWLTFCAFTRAFTSTHGPVEFREDLAYLDDSGGFTDRRAFLYEWDLAGISPQEITVNRRTATCVDRVKHDFGHWEGFERQTALFWFKSCNGNCLAALSNFEENHVRIYVSNTDSNYAKWIKANGKR